MLLYKTDSRQKPYMKIKVLLFVIFILIYHNFVFAFEWYYIKTAKLKPKGIITTTPKLTIRRYEKALSKINANTNLCQQKISYPVAGILTSRFGIRWKKMHKGIDLYQKTGTTIKSAAAGEVIFSGKKNGYGNVIIIKHSNTLKTLYGHNQKNLVKVGDKVKEGQPIALLGSTGNATGPHLHFEILINESQVNPEFVLSCKFNFSDIKLRAPLDKYKIIHKD